MGKLNFGERFYQALANHSTYGKLIEQVELPSNSQLNKNKVSNTIGYVASKTIGIGWRTTASQVKILFKNCPIRLGITTRDERSRIFASFYSPLSTSKNYIDTTCMISPKLTGFLGRKFGGISVVSLKDTRNCPGYESIQKDKELMNSFSSFYETNWLKVGQLFLAEIKGTETAQFCQINNVLIDVEFSLDNMISFFSCVLRMAEHVQANALNELPPPPPPPKT